MAENKTRPTSMSPAAFLNAIEDPQKRRDAKALDKMMRKVSGHKPKLWGSSIVGYGQYHYKYASGREGDAVRIGFSPRKREFAIYIMPGFDGMAGRLKKLGKHKTGSSCLYIKSLEQIDVAVLDDILKKSWSIMAKRYAE